MLKAASVSQLKKALAVLEHDELLDACVRLAKFKARIGEALANGQSAEFYRKAVQELDVIQQQETKLLRSVSFSPV